MTAEKFGTTTSCLIILAVAVWLPPHSSAAPPDPQARIEALAAAHDVYCDAARMVREVDKSVADLDGKVDALPKASQSFKARVDGAARSIKSAQAGLAEANTDFKIVEREVPKTKTVKGPDGQKREVKDGNKKETERVRVAKYPSPQAKAAAVAAAQGVLNTAQNNHQKAVSELKAFSDRGRILQTELAEARKNQREQEKETNQLRSQWLARLDLAGDWSQAEHEELVKRCDEWIRLDALDGSALLTRGLSRFWLGDTKQAVEELGPLADSKWDSQGIAAALRGLARCWQEESFQADFDRAVRLNSREMSVYVCRGLAHCRRQKFTEAAADFHKAAELDPQSAVPHRLLGLLYASAAGATSSEKALMHAKIACELSADEWSGLDSLAAAQAQAGQFDEAVKTIQQAADLAAAEKLQQCLERKTLYAAGKPLRLDWK